MAARRVAGKSHGVKRRFPRSVLSGQEYRYNMETDASHARNLAPAHWLSIVAVPGWAKQWATAESDQMPSARPSGRLLTPAGAAEVLQGPTGWVLDFDRPQTETEGEDSTHVGAADVPVGFR